MDVGREQKRTLRGLWSTGPRRFKAGTNGHSPSHHIVLLSMQFYLGNYQQAINEASTKKLVNKDLTQERDLFLLRSYLAQRKVPRPAGASETASLRTLTASHYHIFCLSSSIILS